MHWVRRLHLYSGLFMLPWVLLYGVTAFLFNHPGAFPDQPQVSFGNAEIEGTALQRLPRPAELAQRVVSALEERAGRPDQPAHYRLVEPNKAAYTDDFVFARVEGRGQEHSVRVDVTDGTGRVATRVTGGPVAPAPFAQPGVAVEGSPPRLVRDAVPAVLERSGLAAGDVTVTSSPELTFLMEAEGRRWQVTYDTLGGAITGRPAGEATGELTTRTFLLRLHLAHGFPASAGARWAWAVAVDAMFVSMVFWGLSGVLMFWQIKVVRGWGALVLLASAAAATALAVGMLAEFPH
jgi:hypothetical protein